MNTLTREEIANLSRPLAEGEKWATIPEAELQALCQMALAYLDAQEWRPMDTAPKIHNHIVLGLAGHDSYGDPIVGAIRYTESKKSGNGWSAVGGKAIAKYWLPLPSRRRRGRNECR